MPIDRARPQPTTATRLDDCPATVIACDVSRLDATLESIDALARLQLAARRRGVQLELRSVEDPLDELIALVGLRDALPSCGPAEHPERNRAPRTSPAPVERHGLEGGDG